VRQLPLNKNFFVFVFALVLFYISGCEKNNSTVVDSVGGAPEISNVKFSLSIINTDTINIGNERKPDDHLTIRGVASAKVMHPEGRGEIKTVGYSVMKTLSSSSNGNGLLHDDGLTPDQIANDNIYSGYVEFQITRVDVGNYFIEIFSDSRSGYQSNTILLPIQIVRLNHPPILSNLIMDSLISIKGSTNQNYIQIIISATDADGQSDIRMVYFDSYRPDGSPSGGNPFLMYDDGDLQGLSGDNIAGDNNYSLKIGLPTSTGTYRFEFYAVDRSNAISNAIIKNIVITN
jgi:hypothetical protein